MKVTAFALLGMALCAFAAQAQDGGQVVASSDGVALEPVFPQLTFERPVDLQSTAAEDERLFVVEQAGRILYFERMAPEAGSSLFLDIAGRVDDRGNEEGLLGLAFHPNYPESPYFYVNYTANNPSRTVIARYTVERPATARPEVRTESEEVLLEFSQPYDNHNGGQIAFGPDDYLYIATGDGGAGGDPQGNAQDRGTLLGAILRIDVDGGGADGYSIPPENPYAGNDQGYREEIFAYGLRNPWRFSFDPETGELWTGDVGQNAYEEVDVVRAGANYGWNIMEGRHCYEPATGCDRSGLEMPVAEYPHAQGRSITGGFVYRGSDVPALRGRYVYADYVSSRFWTLSAENPQDAEPQVLFDTELRIASFGTDGRGELYALAFDGKIYRFTAE